MPNTKHAIELSYVLDEPTFLEAGHALWRTSRRRKGVRVRSYVLLAALPVGLWLALRYGMWFTFFAILALAALHFVFDWPLTRAFMRRGFSHLPAANRAMRWRIDDTGLLVQVEGDAPARISWQALTNVVEEEAGFILFQPHNVHHWLPKAAFASTDDIERFRHLLRHHAPTSAPD